MKLPVLTMLLMLLLSAAPDKTRRTGLRTAPDTMAGDVRAADTAAPDTLRGPVCDSILLSGYDKPLRGRHETLFATNRLPVGVVAIGLTLRYTDAAGRIIHTVARCVRADIPPGDTRMLRWPSWDTNQSFFYARGPQPRTTGVTPYLVDVTTDYIVTYNK